MLCAYVIDSTRQLIRLQTQTPLATIASCHHHHRIHLTTTTNTTTTSPTHRRPSPPPSSSSSIFKTPMPKAANKTRRQQSHHHIGCHHGRGTAVLKVDFFVVFLILVSCWLEFFCNNFFVSLFEFNFILCTNLILCKYFFVF